MVIQRNAPEPLESAAEIVKDCPTPARVRATIQPRRAPMGRGWIILEGGNRGNVLMKSAGAMSYGDLNVGNDVRCIDHSD
jgi:hypothetical protein